MDDKTAKEPSSPRLVSAINESAQHISTSTLAFLAVCVYIGIAVASTTDEMLLLGTHISLPLFDVAVPLRTFYFLVPGLLVFLHLHLLLLQYLLACKIRHYVRDKNKYEEETDLFFASLPVCIFLGRRHTLMHTDLVRFLLGVLLILVTVFLPASLLIALQIQFLPYHSAAITAWHKVLVLFDIALIWYFFIRTPSVPQDDEDSETLDYRAYGRDLGFTRFRSPLAVTCAVLVTLAVAFFVTVIAGGPGVGYELRTGKPRPFPKILSVLTQDLSLKEYEFPKDTCAGADALTTQGVQLAQRDLQGADFTGACLRNADFRGADLTGAVFDNADLREAKFGPAVGMRAGIESLPAEPSPEDLASLRARAKEQGDATSLRKARFKSAKLEGASFLLADLREADLRGATLDGANLTLADLRQARLSGASLIGARLKHSLLDSADLRKAKLWGADLSSARALGTDLWRAELPAADLRRADLRMSKFVEARAELVDFSQAQAVGTDFRYARLYGAVGLSLQGADMRGALLGHVSFCGKRGPSDEEDPQKRLIAEEEIAPEERKVPVPQFSDLRLVDFGGLEAKAWLKLVEELKEKEREKEKEKVLSNHIRLRVPPGLQEPPGDPCIISSHEPWLPGRHPVQGRGLLYYPQPSGPMADWPEPDFNERRYQEEMAVVLVDEACEDHLFAAALARDLSGDSPPRRSLLASAVACEFSRRITSKTIDPASCPAQWLLSKELTAIWEQCESDPLRTDDSP